MRNLTVMAAVIGSLVVGCSGPTLDRPSATSPSSPRPYTVTTASTSGKSSDGLGTWTTEIGVLAGGDPAVVAAFNGASQTAAREQVDNATEGTAGGSVPWTFESHGDVTFRQVAVAQIIYGQLASGAHPTPYLGTIVIDDRTAKPIPLTDLFTDQQAGLNRLSEQATKILTADGMNLAADEPGVAPTAGNFANWIPTAEGLEIHFEPYQFGVALPAVITVPWSALTDVLTPSMADLAKD